MPGELCLCWALDGSKSNPVEMALEVCKSKSSREWIMESSKDVPKFAAPGLISLEMQHHTHSHTFTHTRTHIHTHIHSHTLPLTHSVAKG